MVGTKILTQLLWVQESFWLKESQSDCQCHFNCLLHKTFYSFPLTIFLLFIIENCFYKDSDYFGSDLGLVNNISSASQCQVECQKNPACKVWTLYYNTCYIKHSIPVKSTLINAVSGPAICKGGNWNIPGLVLWWTWYLNDLCYELPWCYCLIQSSTFLQLGNIPPINYFVLNHRIWVCNFTRSGSFCKINCERQEQIHYYVSN